MWENLAVLCKFVAEEQREVFLSLPLMSAELDEAEDFLFKTLGPYNNSLYSGH